MIFKIIPADLDLSAAVAAPVVNQQQLQGRVLYFLRPANAAAALMDQLHSALRHTVLPLVTALKNISY